jgi:hypothetical protein
MLTKFFVAGFFAFCSFDAMAQCFATGSGSGSGSAPASTCPQVRISEIALEWTATGVTVGLVQVAMINPNGLTLPTADEGGLSVEAYLDIGAPYNPAADSFFANAPGYGSSITLPAPDRVSYTGHAGLTRTMASQTATVVVLVKKLSGASPLWLKYTETFTKPTSNMPAIKGAVYYQDGSLTGAKYDIWTNYGFVSNTNYPSGYTYLFAYSHANEAFALSNYRQAEPIFLEATTAVLYRRNLRGSGVNSLGSGLKWKGGTFLHQNLVFTPGEPLQDYLTKEFIHLPLQSTSKFFSY